MTARGFPVPQIINYGGNALQSQDGSGNPLVSLSPTSVGNGQYAGQVILHGANSPDVTDTDHRAWYFGVDVVAATKYRDLAIGKFTAAGTASDADGIYISNGGASPSSIGIGVAQPLDNYPSWRTVIQAPGTGAATYGALLVPFAAGQTGDMLAIGSSNDALTALRMRNDGTIVAHAAPRANTVSATGQVTNGAATLIDANAAFTADNIGQLIATGANFPDGTYVLSVQSATQVTMSANATAGTGTPTTNYTLFGRAFQFRANSGQPNITITNGSGAGAILLSTNLTGIGPGVSNPSATLDVAQNGAANATFKVRTTSWGSFFVTAAGATPGDVTCGTANNTALKLQTNNATRITISSTGAIGFFGAAAVAQPSGTPVAATDLASAITLANALRTSLLNLGLVA